MDKFEAPAVSMVAVAFSTRERQQPEKRSGRTSSLVCPGPKDGHSARKSDWLSYRLRELAAVGARRKTREERGGKLLHTIPSLHLFIEYIIQKTKKENVAAQA